MAKRGLFIGLITLDVLYQVEAPPAANQKIVALDYALAAGGPAANAAVTFAHLQRRSPSALASSPAVLLGSLGQHPLAQLVRAELQPWGVAIADLTPERSQPPPTSSVMVSQATGDRAVVSLNAARSQATAAQIPAWVWQQLEQGEFDQVLIDGHQMAVGAAVAERAAALGIPVMIDGGSWKPGFETVLRWADYALCSANFYPPGCTTELEVIEFLRSLQIPQIAITHGPQPVRYWSAEAAGSVPVPATVPVDTLGAGDIFHGAFCHFLGSGSFEQAIAQSAAVAARACQSFGTRSWMDEAS